MTTNQTIDGVPRELLKRLLNAAEWQKMDFVRSDSPFKVEIASTVIELRALLDAPAPIPVPAAWMRFDHDQKAIFTRGKRSNDSEALYLHPTAYRMPAALLDKEVSGDSRVPLPQGEPTREELNALWDEHHQGHPADFAEDVLERWGGRKPQGEPVAVMYADGSVLTKAECGIAFETCCKVETPLYAEQPAPVAGATICCGSCPGGCVIQAATK